MTNASSMPRVTIGMPVCNGENYLIYALDSLLGQTFKDFELIISDNGSTDNTKSICQTCAEHDSRIRYYRSDLNRGATWNFNRLVDLARGEFFMWAAHDDLWDALFIEKLVCALDENSSVILSYCAHNVIDSHGKVYKKIPINLNLSSDKPNVRFAAGWRYNPQIPVFGLIRTKDLKKTRKIGNFTASDQVLVSELALLGPFYGIPEYLFSYRRHIKQSTGKEFPTQQARIAWFDPSKKGRITFPNWRLLREHCIAIYKAPLTKRQRVFCYASAVRWMIRWRRHLIGDFFMYEPRLRSRKLEVT